MTSDARTPDTLTTAELFDGLDASRGFVDDLRKLGLLQVVAVDPQGSLLWAPSARDTLRRVMALVDAGYAPRDIAVIARKLGLETSRRPLRRVKPPTLWRLPEAAAHVGVDGAAASDWLDRGLVAPDSRDASGAPLLSRASLDLLTELADLTRVGASDDTLTAWASLRRRLDDPTPTALAADRQALDAAAVLLAEVSARVRAVDGACRRLDKRTGALQRVVDRARRTVAAATTATTAPPRRGRKPRKRVRTSVRLREKARENR